MLGRSYQPLNEITIDSAHLSYNYEYCASLNKKLTIAPVLKSNAYGHGLTLVAKLLDAKKTPFFCVDSLHEAYELLKARIQTPILIMGSVHPTSFQTKRLPFSFVVSNKATLDVLTAYQPHAPIHLFVDTGMHREGFLLEELPEVLTYLKKKKRLIAGLMSHLAAGDKPVLSDTISQLKLFESAQDIVQSMGFQPQWIHIAATSGSFHLKDFSSYRIGNLSRVGIGMYGIDPEKRQKLKPILRLTSQLQGVKHVKKGDKIGYDFTYSVNKNCIVGLLPIGYQDGVDRRLSNKGFVKVGSQFCPIIGKVSMNIMVIDVTSVKNPQLGQLVTVISDKSNDKNSVYKIAHDMNAIPYEVLTGLNPDSIRRVVR